MTDSLGNGARFYQNIKHLVWDKHTRPPPPKEAKFPCVGHILQQELPLVLKSGIYQRGNPFLLCCRCKQGK